MSAGPDRALRMLFVNQGSFGRTGPSGHTAVEAALRTGAGADPTVSARFVQLPRWSRAQRALVRSVPVLAALDVDLTHTRWHLVEARRGADVIRREIETFGPDVLHVDSHAAALDISAWQGRLPVLLSVDATTWQWRAMSTQRPVRAHSRAAMGPALRRESRALAAAARVVCRSRWAARSVTEEAPTARPVVLHPGLDTEKFRPAAREPRRLPRLLFVGGRFQDKGGDTLLTAVDDLLGTHLELDVVTTTRLAARPGLRIHRFSHGDPELVRLYQQADLFCMPTEWDSFGIVLLEALACATPVITSPVGAISEWVGTDVGTLVPPRSPRLLRAAIEALLADPGRRESMGGAGRHLIEGGYDARVQSRALTALARQCVAETAASVTAAPGPP